MKRIKKSQAKKLTPSIIYLDIHNFQVIVVILTASMCYYTELSVLHNIIEVHNTYTQHTHTHYIIIQKVLQQAVRGKTMGNYFIRVTNIQVTIFLYGKQQLFNYNNNASILPSGIIISPNLLYYILSLMYIKYIYLDIYKRKLYLYLLFLCYNVGRIKVSVHKVQTIIYLSTMS